MTLEEALAELARVQSERDRFRGDFERVQQDNVRLHKKIDRLTGMVERLTHQVDELLARLGEGPRKPAPEASSDEGTDSPEAPASGSAGAGPPKPPPRRHEHGRGPLPASLPRDTVVIPSPDCCPFCGAPHPPVIDQEETEELTFVRSHFRVKRSVRKVCRCRECSRRITPPLPPMPFERASCTFELMAWVAYAKCGLHLPLDRQRREYVLQGVAISTAMITRWFNRCGDLVAVIAAQLRLELLSDDHIQLDGTGITVLDLDNKGRPAPRGHVVVYCRADIAVYHYSESKHGQHTVDFLTLEMRPDGTRTVWEGTITADAESAHDRLFNDGARIEAGCNAHGLRKFRDDADKAPLLADTALSFIGRFYDIEDEARAAQLRGPALLEYRRRLAGPVSVEFKAWLVLHIEDLLPSNPVRKAMQYYLNHWDALMRFLADPEVPLDNNLSERLLRILAVGRKNWLFAGGPAGARRVCDILSLFETCKLIGVDPYDYLVWALSRVVPHPTNRGLRPSDLTPRAYKNIITANRGPEGFA